MITEDYCGFKVAKLLKERGVKNEYCDNMLLAEDGDTIYKFATFTNRDDAFDATMKFKKQIPLVTHQMALKWLREVHYIYNDILTYTTGKNIQFRWVGYDNGRLFSQEEGKIIYFDTHEQAVEAALLYVLKNLI